MQNTTDYSLQMQKLLILTNKKTNDPVKIGPKTLPDTSANKANKHEKTLHVLSHQGNAI